MTWRAMFVRPYKLSKADELKCPERGNHSDAPVFAVVAAVDANEVRPSRYCLPHNSSPRSLRRNVGHPFSVVSE